MGMHGFGSIPLDDDRPCLARVRGETTICLSCHAIWATDKLDPPCGRAPARRWSRSVTWPLATIIALGMWAALIWGGVQIIKWVRA